VLQAVQQKGVQISRVLARAWPEDRFLSPAAAAPSPADRWRFAALLGGFFLFHGAIVGFVLSGYGLDTVPVSEEQEIPVEIVQQPPPQPPAPAQPPQQAQQDPPKPPAPPIDMTPAHDAPKASKIEKAERESLEDSATGGRVAPKTGQAEKPSPDGTPETAQATSTDATPDVAALKTPDDRPQAEIIQRAEPEPKANPTTDAKAPAAERQKQGAKSLDEMMASYNPVPEYKLGGAPLPSPVSGGGSKTTYLSILYGKIMPHMHVPPGQPHTRIQGAVVIYIDTEGNVLHEAVIKPSGSQALDMAALAAIRDAAPFPRPPKDLPPVRFTYGTN
jgi:TonB family protein